MSFEASVLVLVVTLTLKNLINCVEIKTTDDATIQDNGGSSKTPELEVEHENSSNPKNYRTMLRKMVKNLYLTLFMKSLNISMGRKDPYFKIPKNIVI